MQFSFIIPTYNNGERITSFLENLIKQTFEDYEIIVVNDGSQDNTIVNVNKFIKEHQDIKISLFNIHNQGPGMARNYGIKHAKGKYIWFIDDDDSLYDENSLAKLNDELIAFNYPDIIIFNVMICKDKNEKKYYYTHKQLTTDIYKTPELLLKQQWPWSKIIRREFLINTGVQFPSLYMFEDIYFFTELFLHAKTISLTDNCYYRYIKNSNSLTGSFKNFKTYPKALWHELFTYLKIITKTIDR